MAWLEQSPKDQQAFFKKSLLRSKTSFSSEELKHVLQKMMDFHLLMQYLIGNIKVV